MNIWFLSKERNIQITAFNTTTNNKGLLELWITDVHGNNRKIATGSQAKTLEDKLVEIAWRTAPAIITDDDKFGTNLNVEEV